MRSLLYYQHENIFHLPKEALATYFSVSFSYNYCDHPFTTYAKLRPICPFRAVINVSFSESSAYVLNDLTGNYFE